jgi:putative sterol carrier protein
MKFSTLMMATGLMIGATAAHASALFSNEWAAGACDAWNKNATLTTGLADKWVKNDAGHGFKVIHLYRSDCGDAYQSEMRIALKDGKAMCVYGGAVQTKLDLSVDYLMNGTTEHWVEMGKGEYGPFKAMAFGRLKFQGPKIEAATVMGPFDAFLKLTGEVPGTDYKSCPK